MNRRQFLKTAGAAGMTFAAAPWVIGADKTPTYTTALVGSGWWGMNILRCAIQSGQCRAVALCDVDQRHLAGAAAEVEKLTGQKPRIYVDYREMLPKEKPQIVINATPDHWHALATIDAVKAGAHVYLEKPICHTINEGFAMVKAARDADRIVQVGTHRRVSPHNMSAMEFLRSGKAGKIGMVRSFVHSRGGGRGQATPDSDPPGELNWDLWCGPAPLRPFNARIHPRGFRQFMDFANGQLGDWGIHWMDQILWWTEEKHPRRISSTGGRYINTDNSDAPDTQIATFEFESFTATWEHRHYAGNETEKHSIGVYFYGTRGILHLGWRDGWTFYPQEKNEKVIHVEPKLNAPDEQNIAELWTDFLDAIQNRRLPVCDIDIGRRSTDMALLGMLSLKAGRSVQWNGRTIVGDPEAARLLARPYRSPWVYPT
jgi:predicted dehydrogenase